MAEGYLPSSDPLTRRAAAEMIGPTTFPPLLADLVGVVATLQPESQAKHIVSSLTSKLTESASKRHSDPEVRWALEGACLALASVMRELGGIRSQSFLRPTFKVSPPLVFRSHPVSALPGALGQGGGSH